MNKTYIWIAAVVIVIIGLSVWFNAYNPPVSAPTDSASGNTQEVLTTGPSVPPSVGPNEIADQGMGIENTGAQSAVKEFVVTGSNYAFAPNAMTVKKGDTVKITLKNSGGFHDLRIDEFSVATKKLAAGAEETIQFVADKSGSFEYYCSVGSHRAMGMKGTLIVQ